MSMEKLIEEVKDCIECEYIRACDSYGKTYHSDHESFAVLLEEVEEAKAELATLYRRVALFWNEVKLDASNDMKHDTCKGIERAALLAACESIQVAVVAKKAAMTVCDRGTTMEVTKENV